MAGSTNRLREVALASRSPRRKQILESVGLRVVVVPSSYHEPAYRPADGDPRKFARTVARNKANAAAAEGPPVLVAADTIVVAGASVYGKPRDAEHAREMLRELSGRDHTVYTGFAAVDRAAGAGEDGVESARVTFLNLDEDRIAAYVESGEPLDKAGSYGIQGLGALLIASIAGDFFTVMGLPLARIDQALARLGYRLL